MTVLLAKIRAKQPAATILPAGIYPRTGAAFAKTVPETNALYRKMADGKTIRFFDVAPALEAPGSAGRPRAGALFRRAAPERRRLKVIAGKLAPEIRAALARR